MLLLLRNLNTATLLPKPCCLAPQQALESTGHVKAGRWMCRRMSKSESTIVEFGRAKASLKLNDLEPVAALLAKAGTSSENISFLPDELPSLASM
jgi:hypothetical protein